MRFLLALITALFVSLPSSAAAQANPLLVGRWSSVPNFPLVPVHVHVLPSGGVMFWSTGGDTPQLWNSATQTSTVLAPPGYDLFCSAHSLLADGRLLVTGGHIQNLIGLPNASIYDPIANSWTALPDMNAGRWYPTNTTLANGDVLVVAGSIDLTAGNNPLPQVFQMATGTWRNLTNATLSLDLYPRMHLAPNGKVFNSSPTTITRYLDTSGTGAWTVVANQSYYRGDGSSVLYDDGKILIAGGGDPPVNTAEVIDLNAASPSWRSVASMAFARRHQNATLLANGQVLVTGGTSGAGFNNTTTPVFAAEIWDPGTEQWTTMASGQIPRLYHSTAALLPDGRVIATGGDEYVETEIFEPPYLFQGTRPTIGSAPASVTYGETFFVDTPDAASITQVTWIRFSSVTHASNMDQRFSRLSFSQTAGGLNVVAPSGANLSPPGYYMLFILNGSGVPSVARTIRIGASGSVVPETNLTATPNNPTNSSGASFSFSSSTSGSTFECKLDGGGFGACTTPKTYAGLSGGSHTFQVRAIAPSGGIDPTPASYTWTIDTTAPETNITASPANPSNSNKALFSFASTETGSRFECKLDGGAFVACTSPRNYTNLSSGSHTFQARAIDPAGNVDSTPASYTWTYTPVTDFPDSAVVTGGTLGGGTAASLNADDNVYYMVNSTTTATRNTTWQGIFNAVPNNLANLKITYKGKNSQSCTQRIAIWKSSNSTWVQLSSVAVGTTEVSIANLVPPGSPGDYVSGTTGNGDLKIRVQCTRASNFVASGDLLRIVYDLP